MFLPFASWLHKTSISVAFQHQVAWLWPTCETLHFAGLDINDGHTFVQVTVGNVCLTRPGIDEYGSDPAKVFRIMASASSLRYMIGSPL